MAKNKFKADHPAVKAYKSYIGSIGGSRTSEAKTKACRANASKPRKRKAQTRDRADGKKPDSVSTVSVNEKTDKD